MSKQIATAIRIETEWQNSFLLSQNLAKFVTITKIALGQEGLK